MRGLGFRVGIVWQCELLDAKGLTRRLIAFLDGRGTRGRVRAGRAAPRPVHEARLLPRSKVRT